MQIQRQLPQFNDKKVLIIVASKQYGLLYRAHKGAITKMDTVEEKTPKYSDREGFFFRGRKGQHRGSGAVYEMPKQEIRKKFVKKLARETKKIVQKEKIDEIYLFDPRQNMKETMEALPNRIKEKVVKKIPGNYEHAHPFELLEMIKDNK